MKRKQLFSSLKSRKQISLIFQQGIKTYARDCYLRFLPFDGRAPSPWMVLIAVPRTTKTAVARNRAKRVVRAALERALSDLALPQKPCAAAIFVKETFSSLKFEERVRQLKKIFMQAVEKL